MSEITSELPLPSIHVGGFMYSREVTATLNGEDVPQARISTKGPDALDSRTEAKARSMLEAAPVGAEYVVTQHLDGDQDWDAEDVWYVKVGDSEWRVR